MMWRNKIPTIKQRIEIAAGSLAIMPIYDLANLKTSSFDEKKAKMFFSWASQYNKPVIRSYVSVLVWLCNVFDMHLKDLNCHCIIASAETLSTPDWDLIEKCFGCPCINFYGSTEASPIGRINDAF